MAILIAMVRLVVRVLLRIPLRVLLRVLLVVAGHTRIAALPFSSMSKLTRDWCNPSSTQEGLAVALAGVVRVRIVVAIQAAAPGYEDAGHALVVQNLRHATPLAELHARKRGHVLGLPVHDAAWGHPTGRHTRTCTQSG